jgi:hypothetical protein
MRPFSTPFCAAAALSLFVWSGGAQALALEFVPSFQTVALGDPALVDVRVDDPDGTLIGAFDFAIEYSPTLLSIDNVLFGGALGGGPPDSFQDWADDPTTGTLTVAETSLLFDLTGLQDAVSDLTLVTVVFETLSPGNSGLSLVGNIGNDPDDFLSDALGTVVPLTSVGGGIVTITDNVSPIPLPGVLWLMLPAIGFFVAKTRQEVL